MAELEVVVVDRRVTAEGVVDLELHGTAGNRLPACAPGAHVDVHLPDGVVRQYSIHRYDDKIGTYRIGVGLATPSRGGSRYIHESLRRGQQLRISSPRNNFALTGQAERYFFIAGGIGITPILSMVRWCELHAKVWTLVYCVRSRARAAYLSELPRDGRVILHVDDECGGARPALDAFLRFAASGDHVYCCGPGPLMDAVATTAAFLPSGAVHFERFNADPSIVAVRKGSFRIKLAKTGLEFTVKPDSTILETLEAAGMKLPFSCREGLCRTCEVSVLEGEIDHRDYVLSDEERKANKTMMICVSRAAAEEIDLDL